MIPTNKVKLKLLLVSATLIITATLAAADPAEGDSVILPGRWQTRNSAAKRFDTPLGALYEFRPGDMYLALPLLGTEIPPPPHKSSCNCMECVSHRSMSSLQCAIPRKAQEKRFIAIDFVVRQFPAFDAPRNRELEFVLTQSANAGIADHYTDLTSTLHPIWYHAINQDPLLLPPPPQSYPMFATGLPYLPKFEPVSIRVIYDQTTTGIMYLILNGQRCYLPKFEKKTDRPPIPFRSFGFSVQKIGAMPAANIELSQPRIVAFDREEVLLDFLEDQFRPYPYAAYDREPERLDPRKLRSARNPDFIYANAMHLLYGTDPAVPLDPEEGVRQLRRAAKDGHIFAMYQLGICLFRGLGIAQNEAEALKLFEKTAAGGYARGEAMAIMLQIRQQREKTLITKDFCVALADRMKTDDLLNPWRKYELIADPAYLKMLLKGPTGPVEYNHRQLLCTAIAPDLVSNFTVDYRKDDAALRSRILSRFKNSVFPKKLLLRITNHPIASYDISQYDVAALSRALHEDNYAPAGYALGLRLDWNYQYRPLERRLIGVDAQIDETLKLSAAGGFQLAELLRWKRALAAGQPFFGRTAQLEFNFADEPWFLLLRFAEKHPGHPAVKSFLRSRLKAQPLSLLANDATAEGEYLRGLLTLLDDAGPLCTVAQRFNPGDKPTYTLETYSLFIKSLAQDNPDAWYLIGKLLLENPNELPAISGVREKPGDTEVSATLTRGQYFLRKAAAAGHLKAAYLLAINEPAPGKAIELLKPLREADVIEGWLLTAQLQEKHYGFAAALAAYRQAAALGSPEAYSALALNTADPVKKRVLWHSFLTADKRQRLLDPLDFPAPKAKLLQPEISSDRCRFRML